MTKTQNRIRLLFLISLAIISTPLIAQTTFTESATAYNLNIGNAKDGGHAWADYDLDGDYDLVINTNGRGYLLRNDGASGFTDVTNINGNLAPDFLNGSLERTVLFVDFNNDGYPDVFRNEDAQAKVYLQDPATNKFGDGVGGTTPNQTFNSGNIADGFNSEGAGALDFDGDGDLDIFIDNHDFGIDILLNDGTGTFTHATAKSASPNPPYDVNDATTWPLGLVQDATNGDYGSATDFNNDGWVDIVVRKRSQVDLFTNNAGTFGNEIEIDDASNSNRGAVGFYDFDNDGDFDLYWTENGTNQIHQNNGDGTWTGLGAATGIPTTFSGQMEGLACGDVDNDGDIDIFLSGSNTSLLYLNQINNGGGAMSFIDSGLTFNNTNGEGATFIDIDEDGDLDLYTNRTGSNRLFINNLGATAQANHLYIDIIEDRDAFGLINTETRFGIGATATILDCNGNVISGIREVNGGYGHGTQEPGVIHFGLPGGPNTPIVLEVAYPSTSSGRIVVKKLLTPSDPIYRVGNINLIEILPTSTTTNLPPIAQDDLISVTQGSTITFNPLVDNGNGVDSDPEGGTLNLLSITQPPLGEGTAVLNGDGTITYTPGIFSGATTFTYRINDSNPTCPYLVAEAIGTVFVTVNNDNDGDGIADIVDLDDDNDGILDTVEGYACNNTSPDGGSTTATNFGVLRPFNNTFDDDLTTFGGTSQPVNLLDGSVTYTFSTPIADADSFVFYSNGGVIGSDGQVKKIASLTVFDSSNTIIYSTTNISIPQESVLNPFVLNFPTILNDVASFTLDGLEDDGIHPGAIETIWRDVYISECLSIDTDGDGVPNHLDLDSDNDGILDAEEAGHGQAHTNGMVNGAVGTDGIPDAVQASPNDENTNYTIAESTDDSDTIPNYLDLDSDGDGIPDNIEAQTTTGYNPPNGTVDANGVDTNYTSGLNPTNTDGTDNADYLDTDSDNEGGNDTTEAGITLANADVDNDGLDDSTDATNGYADPGGTIDDPLTAPVILPDLDNDVSTGGDVDFRDATDDRPLISGQIFEDVNYGGGAGRNYTTVNTSAQASGIGENPAASGDYVGMPNARVELYDTSGNFVASTVTDDIGFYTFSQLPGNYSIRAVNSTVTSNRGGAGSVVAVQTFRSDGTSAVTNEVGGTTPTLQDAASNTTNATLASLTTGTTTAQSVSAIVLGATDITGIDFGFNFNTIVNTNSTGQGSLRQYIINSNTLSETGMDIEANSIFDPIPGVDVSIFMIPSTGDPLGRTTDPNFSGGVATITLSSALPAITDNDTYVDGRTQTAYSGNTNPGTVGSGGTVGVDAEPLPTYQLPEIAINGSDNTAISIHGDAGGTLIRNMSIYNSNIGVSAPGNGGTGTNRIVREMLLGVLPDGSDPGVALRNNDYGVRVQSPANLTVTNSYIGWNGNGGILGVASTSVLQATYNEVFQNGWDSDSHDGIDIDGINGTVQYNLVYAQQTNTGLPSSGGGSGIELGSKSVGVGNNLIDNNTIFNNISAGINLRRGPSSNTISKNIIYENEVGIAINDEGRLTNNNLLSQNSIYNNNGLGIDLFGGGAGNFDGITLNDLNDSDTGSNDLVNFPVFESIITEGTNIRIKGWARPGATIELFITDISEGTASVGDNQLGLTQDYGEGQTYLTTLTEGSGVDLSSASSLYNDPDGNTDNTNEFEFVIPLPSGVTLGTFLTATATVGNSTSEFSPIVEVIGIADLSLSKTVDNASPDQGNNITFTLTIRNDGPSSPTNIIVTDIIPTDFTYTHPNFSTTQGTVIYNAGTREFQWNLGAFVLGVGNTITLEYTVTVDICGEFTNQAEIMNSSLADPDSTPNFGG